MTGPGGPSLGARIDAAVAGNVYVQTARSYLSDFMDDADLKNAARMSVDAVSEALNGALKAHYGVSMVDFMPPDLPVRDLVTATINRWIDRTANPDFARDPDTPELTAESDLGRVAEKLAQTAPDVLDAYVDAVHGGSTVELLEAQRRAADPPPLYEIELGTGTPTPPARPEPAGSADGRTGADDPELSDLDDRQAKEVAAQADRIAELRAKAVERHRDDGPEALIEHMAKFDEAAHQVELTQAERHADERRELVQEQRARAEADKER